MLEAALKTRVPLIVVHCRDPLQDDYVLDSIIKSTLGRKAMHVTSLAGIKENWLSGQVVVVEEDLSVEQAYLYKWATQKSGIVVCKFYSGDTSGTFFDAGTLMPTDQHIHELIEAFDFCDPEEFEAYVSVLRGLTLSEIDHIIRMAPYFYGGYSVTSVVKTRAKLQSNTPGVETLDTLLEGYTPNKYLLKWLGNNSKVFLECDEPTLVPRGLAFTGPPGTGKTLGAKYLASELDIPLVRLDLAAVMSKWLGESESHLRAALTTVERSSPCVMLIDEVEKIFAGGDNDSVKRMLSYLLWWLQEHRSRVLTIMTTNKQDDLPPELYRPGRIDAVVEFGRISTAAEALEVGATTLEYYKAKGLVSKDAKYSVEDKDLPISHTELVQQVREWVKLNLI